MAVELQERDINFLKTLSKYGCLSRKTINIIYGAKQDKNKTDKGNKYPKAIEIRKKRLSVEGYIIKTNTYAYLGEKGKRYLEKIGVEEIKHTNGTKYTLERLAKISSILYPLEDTYEITPSWKIKTEDDSNKKRIFYGTIKHKITGREYYIFNIGGMKGKEITESKKNIKSIFIKRLKTEVRASKDNENKPLNNMIVFAEDKPTMDLYRNNAEKLTNGEQLLMPYPWGIDLIKFLGQYEIKKFVMDKLYGDNYTNGNSVIDYRSNDISIVVLIHNDLEKILSLKIYCKANFIHLLEREKDTPPSLRIICLDIQVASLKEEFQGLNVEYETLEFNS